MLESINDFTKSFRDFTIVPFNFAEPDQVKYHSGETPHPNRVDPSKSFQVMSEAEDNDDDLITMTSDIIEVNPGEVHIHEATQKQMGLLVPPKPIGKARTSKSPSPHLAIISDFIEG